MKAALRVLSGPETKTLLALLWEGQGGKVERVDLEKYGITPDQLISHAGRLSSLGILRMVFRKGNYEAEFLNEWSQLSAHLETFTPQLKLLEDDTKRKSADGISMKQIKELAVHYAILKGCPTEKLGTWFSENFKRGIRAFRKVMEAGGDLERAKSIITSAAGYYDRKGISWSVEGAVLKNLHQFTPKIVYQQAEAPKTAIKYQPSPCCGAIVRRSETLDALVCTKCDRGFEVNGELAR